MKQDLINIFGVRHQRHARNISSALMKVKGIEDASVALGGSAHLKWDTERLNDVEFHSTLKKNGLSLKSFKSNLEKLKQLPDFKNQIISNTELSFAIISGVFWIIGFSLYIFQGELELFRKAIYAISIAFGGYYTLIEAAKAIIKGKFEIDFLMLFAAIGAMILGKWGDASLLLFLFSLGHALEHYAMSKARKSITALVNLASHTALVKKNGRIEEINIEQLHVNDIIVIKPNTKIPADGVIIKGNSTVDQSPITGESIPVGKKAIASPEEIKVFRTVAEEQKVFAGTINGSGILEVNVRKLAKDSTLARLIALVKEAETQKSPTQHLADNFERYYVPIVLIVVIILLFAFIILDESFQESFYRAMAVLIAASPCALAISTPSAVLAAIARAAKKGVLIKGGRPLEDLAAVNAIAFDKTGTLTEGKPKLTHVIPYKNNSSEKLLRAAIAVESLSDHPLAKAIVDGAKSRLDNPSGPLAEDLKALIARGVKASYKGKDIYIGNRRLFQELTKSAVPDAIDKTMTKIENEGNTAMIVYWDNQYLGIIGVMDVARAEAKSTIESLKKIGIKKTLMLTGDNQKVAVAIAKVLGISNPQGDLLPEDKVNAIHTLQSKNYKVAMIGDGVNDAPAMARSSVGVAMGAAGSDVALETADIALMADKLENLPFAIALSRKAKSIIKQNLIISLGMVALLVPLTLFGIAEIGPAVVGHEGSTLIVVLNALRLLKFELD